MEEKKFGEAVKKIRLKKGFSAERLAKESEVSAMHIGRIERGAMSPTLKMMRKIAKGLEAELVVQIKTKRKSK